MILFLDIGNTRIKPCLYKEGIYTLLPAVVHSGLHVQQYIDGLIAPSSITALYVSDVAGLIKKAYLRGLELPTYHYAVTASPLLALAYAQPAKLGVDRWLAMLAVVDDGADLCVVMAGSAITVDYIEAGVHRGGRIFPGLAALASCYANISPALAGLELEGACDAWGATTKQCMNASVCIAVRAVISEGLSDTVSLRLSGGDGPMLAELMADAACYDEKLIFKGMVKAMELAQCV